MSIPLCTMIAMLVAGGVRLAIDRAIPVVRVVATGVVLAVVLYALLRRFAGISISSVRRGLKDEGAAAP